MDNLKTFRREIGFISGRKRKKLDDVIEILGKSGDRIGATVKWISRYEYRIGCGRERWFPRESPLQPEEAWEEYERHLNLQGSGKW